MKLSRNFLCGVPARGLTWIFTKLAVAAAASSSFFAAAAVLISPGPVQSQGPGFFWTSEVPSVAAPPSPRLEDVTALVCSSTRTRFRWSEVKAARPKGRDFRLHRPPTTYFNIMRMKTPTFLLAMATGLALSGFVLAGDFFDSTLTIQGTTLDLGEAGRSADYAIFVTKGSLDADGSTTGSQGAGGNVGVSKGSVNLNDGSVVNGIAIAGKEKDFNVEPPSMITGGEFDAKLNDAAKDAKSFAQRVASLCATSNYSSTPAFNSNLFLNHSSLTISATDSNPVVLKLANFSLNAGTFTLVGTAMSKFIIDIDQSMNLSNGSRINLSGGLLAGNVVFNVEHGGINLSDSAASGILVAAKGSASLSNSTVTGEVIAKYVDLNDGSHVKKPHKPSL